jgi:hypothetical protein
MPTKSSFARSTAKATRARSSAKLASPKKGYSKKEKLRINPTLNTAGRLELEKIGVATISPLTLAIVRSMLTPKTARSVT